jgi:hypothetical protein
MINTKETLKKLHKKFPLMTLDELFEIIDCYVEESISLLNPTQPWTVDKVWCNNDPITISTTAPANEMYISRG